MRSGATPAPFGAAPMRLPEPMRRVVLRMLPWYHEREVEARHAETRRVLRNARRALEVAESYRRADDVLGRMSGR